MPQTNQTTNLGGALRDEESRSLIADSSSTRAFGEPQAQGGREVELQDYSLQMLKIKEMEKKSQAMEEQMKKDRVSIQEMKIKFEEKKDDEEGKISLDTDTFSIMMTSKVCSSGWALGLITFVSQMTLLIMILLGQSRLSKDSTLFDAPFTVSNEVRVGQFFAIILSLFYQSDVLTAMQYLSMFKNHEYDRSILLVDDDESILSNKSLGDLFTKRGMRYRRAVLPNILKMVQGLLVLVTSLVVIIQSDDLIDLLKDFTALFFVSEIDNNVFRMTEQRFFGDDLKKRSDRVKKVLVEDKAVIIDANPCCRRGINFRFMILFSLFVWMLFTWGYFVQGQVSGKFFVKKYPSCRIKKNDISKFGDGRCDGSIFNSIGCGFDGGDCINFNLAYPNCDARTDAYTIGDGNCNEAYNTADCLYDGGDCCPFDKKNTSEFNNDVCNGGLYNTKACDYDGGECETFNSQYPDCPLQGNVTNSVILGDGVCDSGVYMTEECGYEDGDCLHPAYPDCKGVNPYIIGNGQCYNVAPYNTEACGWDDGDCLHPDYPDCHVGVPGWIRDNVCDGGSYNTAECGWDGSDCLVADYPDCHVDKPKYIGDGNCDGGSFNTTECGYDGGDCLPP
jgi:hypothetical protein